jgi:hypothetical protein
LLPTGQVVVAGGRTDGGGSRTAEVEVWDATTAAWVSLLQNAAEVREQHSATLLASGEILLVGGQGSNGNARRVHLFDPLAPGAPTFSVYGNTNPLGDPFNIVGSLLRGFPVFASASGDHAGTSGTGYPLLALQSQCTGQRVTLSDGYGFHPFPMEPGQTMASAATPSVIGPHLLWVIVNGRYRALAGVTSPTTSCTGGMPLRPDRDGDTYGDANETRMACGLAPPPGWTGTNMETDCADQPGSDPRCGGLDGRYCHPGLPDTTCNDIDENCSGTADEGFMQYPTTCYTNSCQAHGHLECVGGQERDTCVPPIPASDDPTCDNVDEDCDGVPDDNYVGHTTTCGLGVCASTGTSSCPAGTELPNCYPGMPVANPDLACNSLDEDCDGPVDEEAVCTSPDACTVAVCNRAVGQCEFEAIPRCCTSNADCTGLSCFVASCEGGECVLAPEPGCCAAAGDCDDNDPCTAERCEAGSCATAEIPGCCHLSADCEDGNDCSFDTCTAAHRCQHQPLGCDPGGPCGADPTCVWAAVRFTRGAATPRERTVSAAAESPVLQLGLDVDAIGAALSTLALELDVEGEASGTLAAELWQDEDGDGEVDLGSQPLASVTAVPLADGALTFTGLSLARPPASSTHLLVTLELEHRLARRGSAWPAGLALSPLLIGGVLGRRWRTRRRALVATLLALIAIGLACSYQPLSLKSAVGAQATLSLVSNDDVLMTTATDDEKVVVEGAPIVGEPFSIAP